MKSGLYDVPLMFLSILFRVAIACLGLWLFTASIHFSLSAYGEVASMDFCPEILQKHQIFCQEQDFFSSFQRLVFSYKKKEVQLFTSRILRHDSL